MDHNAPPPESVTERLFRQQALLVELIQSEVFRGHSLEATVHHLLRETARALGVARVSVWRFNAERSAIICYALYERAADRFSAGAELRVQDYPAYFRALAANRVIPADDARTDGRTAEFTAGYLTPLGITSMMDAPICLGGTPAGVLCHEHVGPPRQWSPEEQLFGTAVANLVALALEQCERRRAEEAARDANRAKSDFLSRMSHELRTPLNAVLGFAQLLEMDALPPHQADSVQQILKGGKHLLDLINEVLDISRIEAGTLKVATEPVPPERVIQETIDLVKPLAQKHQVTLDFDPAAAGNRPVVADRQRLKQVLLNLLTNAVKYNRPWGQVRVCCAEKSQGRLRVEVADTGPGIPVEKLGRLFTPFDRLDAERTAIEGTGLGLALSKRLVEMMHGSLTVTSQVGEGSVFAIELPRAGAAPVADAGEVPAPQGPAVPVAAATVLLIEDNLANLQLIERLLARRGGLRLLAAMHGSLGLDLARQHRPDLILLDVHLPDLPGHEVLARLRAAPETSAIPVLVLSADALPSQIARLRGAGAADYLTKPLDVQQFFAAVERHLPAPG